MREPGRENTMYTLRSKSVNYVTAYPLPCTLNILQGVGKSTVEFYRSLTKIINLRIFLKNSKFEILSIPILIFYLAFGMFL